MGLDMERLPAHPKKPQTHCAEKGIEVDVVNAKEQKIKDVSKYDLVIVGSGIQMHRWTNESENFSQKTPKRT